MWKLECEFVRVPPKNAGFFFFSDAINMIPTWFPWVQKFLHSYYYEEHVLLNVYVLVQWLNSKDKTGRLRN